DHCRLSQRYLVRPDGGTAHEALLDPETGQFDRTSTQQGWSADSTWSRGLAWAIYGFTAVYRLSGEGEFLETARPSAGYSLRHPPPGMVPYFDFDVPPDGPRLWDSSAAAVAASGLWDLAEAVTDLGERGRYSSGALNVLQTLCSNQFLARCRPEWEGI